MTDRIAPLTSGRQGHSLLAWYARAMLIFLALTVLGQLVIAVLVVTGWFGVSLPNDVGAPAARVFHDMLVNLPAFFLVVGVPTAVLMPLLIPAGRRLPPVGFRMVALVLLLLPAPWLLILYNALALFVVLLLVQVATALLVPSPRRTGTPGGPQ